MDKAIDVYFKLENVKNNQNTSTKSNTLRLPSNILSASTIGDQITGALFFHIQYITSNKLKTMKTNNIKVTC